MNSKKTASNPYDYINEVSDPALFAGRREELAQLEEEVARLAKEHPIAPMVAIVGERRIGKTSASLRVQEICDRLQVLPLRVSLTDTTAEDSWEFWNEIFHGLLSIARLKLNPQTPNHPFGLGIADESVRIGLNQNQLGFSTAYNHRTASVPPNHLVYETLKSLIAEIIQSGQNGVLLIIDEAHLVVSNRGITQQLRFAIRAAGRCGVLFVGEPSLAQLFANHDLPLFAQGKVIQLDNFATQQDTAECALLPLDEEEQRLVSPMTIDYLVRLSQGKPNQIRLICHSIYNRYLAGHQTNLNITIEALDDVLDSIAATYTEYDVRQKVDTIRRLNSVDLETLYNMTRYPHWDLEEIVELDESFRAEGKSLAAGLRREAMLREKREKFVDLGLMVADPQKYTLDGDEFLALYLRFWYEIKKHGELSRSLVLGKGPPTPFGEKTEKLVRFLAWELGRPPSIVRQIFNPHDNGNEDRIAAVRSRFSVFQDLVSGKPFRLTENPNVINEWFRTCELVRNPGPHYLLCLSVRNLDNPRETMGIEVYFDSPEEPLIVLNPMLSSLRQHADDSRIVIEGWDYFAVDLPSVSGLLEMIGAPRLEELMAHVGPLVRWWIASVQHHVGSEGSDNETEPDLDAANDEDPSNWVKLYGNRKFVEAEDALILKLQNENERQGRARLFNDLGYIRYELQKKAEARRDLEQALDLHFFHLPLTLANLGVACLDDGDYEEAINYFRDAIFLTLTPEDISAAYLRLRLPSGPLARRSNWEQHPANVLEASYINLSYALLRSGSVQDATQVLQEGLELIPSSVRLKHACARLHVSQSRVDLAEPIYRELAQQPTLDPTLANEVRTILRSSPRHRPGRRKNR